MVTTYIYSRCSATTTTPIATTLAQATASTATTTATTAPFATSTQAKKAEN